MMDSDKLFVRIKGERLLIEGEMVNEFISFVSNNSFFLIIFFFGE